jgi:vitamin B12 transporter
MTRSGSLVLLAHFLFSPSSQASPIIVTGDQFERPYRESTSSIELITREQIERSAQDSVADLLKQSVGLSVPTNGPFGKTSSVQIRGADARHTLVLIDGVRATDITSLSGGARLEFLSLDQVESIEILRGSQSVLYGSEAIGGVLKITTRKPDKRSTSARLAYGSYNNRQGSFSTRNKVDFSELRMYYLLGANLQKVDGISAFNADKALNADEDGLEQSDLLAKLRVVKGKHEFQAGVQSLDSTYEYDEAKADNSNNFGEYESLQFFSRYTLRQSDLINLDLSFTSKSVKRNLFEEYSFGKFNFLYEGNFKRLEAKNRMRLIAGGDSIVGFEYEREGVEALASQLPQEKIRERVASYINHYQKLGAFFGEVGVRGERFQFGGEQLVYKSALGYLLDDFTLKGSYATGFKAPSLYQSFSIFAAPEPLALEESKSSELSIVFQSESSLIEFTGFEIRYNNFIDFDSPLNQYINRGDFILRGAEASAEHQEDDWLFKGAYTLTRSKDRNKA